MTNDELVEAIKVARYNAWNTNPTANPELKKILLAHFEALLAVQLKRALEGSK